MSKSKLCWGCPASISGKDGGKYCRSCAQQRRRKGQPKAPTHQEYVARIPNFQGFNIRDCTALDRSKECTGKFNAIRPDQVICELCQWHAARQARALKGVSSW